MDHASRAVKAAVDRYHEVTRSLRSGDKPTQGTRRSQPASSEKSEGKGPGTRRKPVQAGPRTKPVTKKTVEAAPRREQAAAELLAQQVQRQAAGHRVRPGCRLARCRPDGRHGSCPGGRRALRLRPLGSRQREGRRAPGPGSRRRPCCHRPIVCHRAKKRLTKYLRERISLFASNFLHSTI